MYNHVKTITSKKKVIIDTDMGWDDVLSVLYLIKCPDIDIIGVTVTGCGETNLRWGSVIALTLLALGKQNVTVCNGTDTPTQLNHVFPQDFRNDMNDVMGLLGSLNPKESISLDRRPAWQYLSEALDETEEEITILSIGGFTNIAKMLEEYPATCLKNLKGIYAMAGAIFVDGNVQSVNNAKPSWNQGPLYSSNYRGEWNVFIDPFAAKKVFDSIIPLTLIPLDACNYVLLSPEYPNVIKATDPIASLVKSVFLKKNGSSSEGIPVPIFDPLAAMIMAGRLTEYESLETFLDVCTTDTEIDNHCGNTFVTDSGSRKIKIVQGLSQHSFEVDFSAVINLPWD